MEEVHCTTQKESRQTILGPADSQHPERYVRREGVAAREPINFTHFRVVERRYKNKNGPFDGSDAVDLRDCAISPKFVPFENFSWDYVEKHLPSQSEIYLHSVKTRSVKAYTIDGLPDLIVLPGILQPKEQYEILYKCFTEYMQHPNQCNLNTHYNIPQDMNLFKTFVESKITGNTKTIARKELKNCLCKIQIDTNKELEKSEQENDAYTSSNAPQSKDPFVTVNEDFLRHIRWFTIGYQYDWTTKEYVLDKHQDASNNFPPLLKQVAVELCSALGFKDFCPEAGVINMYQLRSTLMGHVDRSEKNMTAPLVSLSIGNSCVFLFGGLTREDPVTPLILNSGDAVLFFGQSRLCYHGVPRILENTLPSHFKEACGAAEQSNDTLRLECLRLIHDARLNINIRQVY